MFSTSIIVFSVITVIALGLGIWLWPTIKEGLQEGLEEHKQEEAEAEAQATAKALAEQQPLRDELAQLGDTTRYGIALQAMFREFRFNGPLVPLDWTQANIIWMESYHLPEKELKETKEALEREWGISDTVSMCEKINWLIQEGHREQFETVFTLARAVNGGDFEINRIREKPLRDMVTQTSAALEDFEDISADAFDLARAASLITSGMAAGLLTRQEGEDLLAQCWDAAQSRFSSWRHYGESVFLGGSLFFKGTDAALFTNSMITWWRKTIDWLNQNELSPWRRLPWSQEAQPSAEMSERDQPQGVALH